MSRYSLHSELLLQQPLYIPYFSTRSPPFPEGKEVPGKSNWSRCIQCCPVGQGYLKEDDRVPKWWREFPCLLQCPSDSLVQKLAHHQAMASWLPTTQLEKNRWWTVPPCLEVLGWRKYLPPKDFHWSHDYQEVRKEEMAAMTVALQSCAVRSGTPSGVLCGVIKELCQCLAPSLRETVS